MIRVALKSAFARKGRLLLTSLAVVLGTAFVAGSLIFTDTIQRTFDQLFADVNKNTDAYVRSSNVIEGDFGFEVRGNLPEGTVAEVGAIAGVSDAQGAVQGSAAIIKPNGDPVSGTVQFGSNLNEGELQSWKIIEGERPSGPDQVVLDKGSFKRGDFELGDTVRVVGAGGSKEYTIVGVAQFGDVDSPGGATFALFDLPTAQELLLNPDLPDKRLVDAILVRGDGSVSDDELADRIQQQLGSDVQVLTGAEITAENQSDIKEGLRFFTIFLTIFALIALFVGAFVIANVFSITQAQRRQENALLRAIGASRRQVSASMFVEAFIIGLLGSALGLLFGIGLAKLLQQALKGFGIDFPAEGLDVQGRTVIATLIAGLVVTLIAAVAPALRAGKVPPVAAMRESALELQGSSRGRFIGGFIVLALSVGLILLGLFAGKAIALAPGIPLLFIALYVLGPLIARPFARVLGAPIQAARGITGRLARDNASRNPKRTSRTAAALLIGVALVTGVTVVTASIKSSIREIFGEQFTGDFTVSPPNTPGGGPGGVGFSTTLADQLDALPGVEAAAGIGFNVAMIDGRTPFITVVNPATAGKVFNLDYVDGSTEDLTAEGVQVSESEAKKRGYQVGDVLPVTLADGSQRELTVQGIYQADELAGAYTVSRDLFAGTTLPVQDFGVFILTDPGADQGEVRTEIEQVVDDYGLGEVQSRDEYIDSQGAQLNTLVQLVYGLLALSVFIAVVGIIITLLLSVFERRRELALLRAVGSTRPQVWGMVSWEAVITALLGTIEGILVGLLLGYSLVLALRDQGFRSFTIPWSAILIVLIGAALIGILAAVIPARRATKVDIVRAIATT